MIEIMPKGLMQNELNMIMREASKQAMIEAQNRKQKAVVEVKQPLQNEMQCTTQPMDDGSILLICSIILNILIK